MEMPTPCRKCNEVFDLNDGYASQEWFPHFVICMKCGKEEEKEIETKEEIQDLKENIKDARITIQDAFQRLKELGEDHEDLFLHFKTHG